ncbi:MAG: phosphoribosyl-AMP cyclohydrolase [Candidatus Omnitrophica bacterium]|nr:phosphoribosyl-AMP cyclohydrolase [Candidatus Omnitrophota bacterium]
MDKFIEQLKFNDDGLIPAVIQDSDSGKVLTLCYMNKESLEMTFKEGKVYLFRRSKSRLMMKGETSGHIQILKEALMDCEGKSLLLKIEQKVAACHAGYFTCYYRRATGEGGLETVEEKVFDPGKVY